MSAAINPWTKENTRCLDELHNVLYASRIVKALAYGSSQATLTQPALGNLMFQFVYLADQLEGHAKAAIEAGSDAGLT